MAKVKTKKAPRVAVSAAELDFDKLFEVALAPPPKREKKARGKAKQTPAAPKKIDGEKRDLIKRIKKIYRDNEFPSVTDLTSFTPEQLRNHLNRLQWGLIEWMTRKGIVPDPPDEYPVKGFRCETSFHRVWTNSSICQSRTYYPSLYPACGRCIKWEEERG